MLGVIKVHISGGLVRGTTREILHTERMYEEIRNRRKDYLIVAKKFRI